MRLPFERFSILAGLRFFLASIVLLTHIGHYAGASWASALGSAAFEAIAGFLVVSGYSIGHSYSVRPQGFYVRRAERILPSYAAGLLLALTAFGWPGIGVLLANLFFLNQLVTSESFLGPAWSLALEVWLYALAPWLARRATRTLWLLAGASFAAFMLYSALRWVVGLPYYAGLGYGANLLMLSWLWIAGFILGTRPDQRRTLAVLASALLAAIGLLFAIQAVYQFRHHRLDLLLTADVPLFLWRGLVLALVAGIFLAIVTGRTGGAKSRMLNLLGDISYPLYLVHVPVIVIALRYGFAAPWTLILLAVVMAAGTALVFEWPVRQLRRSSIPSAIAAAMPARPRLRR